MILWRASDAASPPCTISNRNAALLRFAIGISCHRVLDEIVRNWRTMAPAGHVAQSSISSRYGRNQGNPFAQFPEELLQITMCQLSSRSDRATRLASRRLASLRLSPKFCYPCLALRPWLIRIIPAGIPGPPRRYRQTRSSSRFRFFRRRLDWVAGIQLIGYAQLQISGGLELFDTRRLSIWHY